MTFDANGDLIEVDDGGVIRRTNPGNNTGDWFSINGDIQVTEFHSIAYDTNFNIIIGGTQDTGAPEQTAPGSATWNSLAVRPMVVRSRSTTRSRELLSATSVSKFWEASRGAPATPAASNAFPALTGRGPAQFYTPLEINAADPTRLAPRHVERLV